MTERDTPGKGGGHGVTRETADAAPEGAWPAVFAAAMAGVVLTRWPVARLEPFDADEFIIVEIVRSHWFHVYHTLFLTFGRLFGAAVGDAYRGFVVLDMVTSALALTAVWWWLRALVRPATAALATLALAAAPLFWAYGAMAGSYTGIVAVGSFLLGVAVRTWRDPRPWHPFAAAAVLALGTGYRHDIGTLWLPVFVRHPLAAPLGAGGRGGGACSRRSNLTWIGLMLHEAGGWANYREETQEFAHQMGYLNSVWNLGLVDAPLRYGVKLVMALLWTFGPGLVFVPRGLWPAGWRDGPDTRPGPALDPEHGAGPGAASAGPFRGAGLRLPLRPGAGGPDRAGDRPGAGGRTGRDRAPARLAALAVVLAAVVLVLPDGLQPAGVPGRVRPVVRPAHARRVADPARRRGPRRSGGRRTPGRSPGAYLPEVAERVGFGLSVIAGRRRDAAAGPSASRARGRVGRGGP